MYVCALVYTKYLEESSEVRKNIGCPGAGVTDEYSRALGIELRSSEDVSALITLCSPDL